MSGQRLVALLIVCVGAASAFSRTAQAAELRADLSALGQVREDYPSGQVSSPNDIYGDLGVSGLHHGTSLDTYFRLEHDFGTNQGPTEFYSGAMRVPGAIPGVDFTLGRQVLSEAPGTMFLADAGKVRIDPGWPLAFTVFGGQPRYFEPTYGPERLSQDEQVFGGSVRTTHLKNGFLSLGYLQQDRDQGIPGQRVLRQLINATGSRSFNTLPGLPNAYGSVVMDAKRQNVDQATAGFDTFFSQPRVSLNFESSYYKPQDNGKQIVTDPVRREDPIFQLFSVSQMLQFRGGLRYTLTRTVSAFGDYSYQRYEQLAGNFVNGHVGSTGLLWLPGGDGLEVVRLEYYVVDSGGGNVNGGKLYYENRVYDRIRFRSKVDVSYYEKATNQKDTAVNTFLGLGYLLRPGLFGELNFEANRNQFFNEDFRFGFLITYSFRSGRPSTDQYGGTT